MKKYSFPLRKSLVMAIAAGGLLSSFHVSAEVVKVAFIDVLSGPFGKTGEGSLNQLREVTLQLNAKAKAEGNDTTFEIVPIDGKGTPQESVVALKSAVNQGIHYITQGGGSGVAFALSDAIAKVARREPEKAVVYLNYSAMDPGLTNERCNFWHFRFYPSSEMQIEALTTYLTERPDVKKVFLFNQNYTHGQQVSKASRSYLAKKRPDVAIVGEDFVPIASVRDFSPYIAKIKAAGADTVITSNWGSDLTLFLKAAKEGGLDINFFTLNANNPGTPAALGSWGAEKVGVIWNWGHNAPTPELEKTYVAYKAKSDEDFIFAAHWNSMSMLSAAIQKAKSTEPKKVAYALEGMKYKSPVGDVEMRKADHQLQAPLFLGIWAKQGTEGVKYDSENTGYGFRSESVWDTAMSSQPTSCKMVRP